MEERYTKVYRASVFEYLKRAIIIFVISSIVLSIGGGWISWSIVAILVAILGVGFANLNSCGVYMDEAGVWYYQGFLPWSKGRYGIGWQDCGGAGYTLNFSSYIFKSYDITINHRFTNTSNLVIKNIHRGDEFVGLVNEYLAKLHQANV